MRVPVVGCQEPLVVRMPYYGSYYFSREAEISTQFHIC